MSMTNPVCMNPDFFVHESEFVYLYLSYKNVNKVTKPLQNS